MVNRYRTLDLANNYILKIYSREPEKVNNTLLNKSRVPRDDQNIDSRVFHITIIIVGNKKNKKRSNYLHVLDERGGQAVRLETVFLDHDVCECGFAAFGVVRAWGARLPPMYLFVRKRIGRRGWISNRRISGESNDTPSPGPVQKRFRNIFGG